MKSAGLRIVLTALLGLAGAVAMSAPPGGPGGGRGPASPGRMPDIQRPVPSIPQRPDTVGVDRARQITESVRATPRGLASAQVQRLREAVRAAPDRLEMVDRWPALRREIIAVDPDAAGLAAIQAAGFRVVSDERIEGLGLGLVTLEAPSRISVQKALAQLKRIAPQAEFSANHIHLQSGQSAMRSDAGKLAHSALKAGPRLGIIDGGVAAHPSLSGGIEQRGFASGAPTPNAHATAIASLAVGKGSVGGAAPGAGLLVADVYGRDPAGGSALAIARALGWMVERRVPVVVISLVGPANPLLARAISRVREKGIHIVAPVGNDGPAAPPPFPASYPGVLAVSAVDGRNRVLAEAGRAPRLDYVAPGADMGAAHPSGQVSAVRGTSFAAPLVAGRLLLAHGRSSSPLSLLDREAEDLGAVGPDKTYGRGLICGNCRTPVRKN
jgi:minor extracellular protease Epr